MKKRAKGWVGFHMNFSVSCFFMVVKNFVLLKAQKVHFRNLNCNDNEISEVASESPFLTQLLYGLIGVWRQPAPACLVQTVTVNQLWRGWIDNSVKHSLTSFWMLLYNCSVGGSLDLGRCLYLAQKATAKFHFSGTTDPRCFLWQKRPNKIHTSPVEHTHTHQQGYTADIRSSSSVGGLLLVSTWFLTGLTAPWSLQSQLSGAGVLAGGAGFIPRWSVHWLSRGFRYVERNSSSEENADEQP